jgi:hypothetical protein
MPKSTLLEITQEISNDLDTDIVNSINDTEESLQIISIIKSVYYDLINRRDWPHLKEVGLLDNVGDTAKPTHMLLPTSCREIEFVNYNKRKTTDTRDKYDGAKYVFPDVFIWNQNQLDDSQSNVTQVTDFSGVTFNVRNDLAPAKYTSFDDEYLVFDSFDSAVDTTLQQSKTQVGMIRDPAWVASDTFIPDLPVDAFPLFIEEAKSACSLKLRQVADEKAEMNARRQERRMSGKMWRTNGQLRTPDYGRKRGKSSTIITKR